MLELLRGGRDVVRVGHRGAAALAPENSLAAIETAAVHGMDVVEVDVNRRADGVLVLAHGPVLARDAPALEEGLELAGQHGLAVQLDIKLPGAEREIAAALRRHDLLERAFVSSFALATLEAFAREEPMLPRSYTYPDDRYGLFRCPGAPARASSRPGGASGRAAAAPARVAAERRSGGCDAELDGGEPRGRRRVPRARGGRLRLDGERPGRRANTARNGYRRYHHGRSAAPGPDALTVRRAGSILFLSAHA